MYISIRFLDITIFISKNEMSFNAFAFVDKPKRANWILYEALPFPPTQIFSQAAELENQISSNKEQIYNLLVPKLYHYHT
jgi:hypothetical protein